MQVLFTATLYYTVKDGRSSIIFAVAYKAQVAVLSGSAVFVFMLHEAEHFKTLQKS